VFNDKVQVFRRNFKIATLLKREPSPLRDKLRLTSVRHPGTNTFPSVCSACGSRSGCIISGRSPGSFSAEVLAPVPRFPPSLPPAPPDFLPLVPLGVSCAIETVDVLQKHEQENRFCAYYSQNRADMQVKSRRLNYKYRQVNYTYSSWITRIRNKSVKTVALCREPKLNSRDQCLSPKVWSRSWCINHNILNAVVKPNSER